MCNSGQLLHRVQVMCTFYQPPPPIIACMHNYGNNNYTYKFIFSIGLDVQNKHWLGCYSHRMAREINDSNKLNVSIWQERRQDMETACT